MTQLDDDYMRHQVWKFYACWFILHQSLFLNIAKSTNKLACVQKIVWHWTGDKPLPDPIMTQLDDDYMRHQGWKLYAYFGVINIMIAKS